MACHSTEPPPAPQADPVCVMTPVLLICRQPAETGSVAGSVIEMDEDGAPEISVVVLELLVLPKMAAPATEPGTPSVRPVVDMLRTFAPLAAKPHVFADGRYQPVSVSDVNEYEGLLADVSAAQNRPGDFKTVLPVSNSSPLVVVNLFDEA